MDDSRLGERLRQIRLEQGLSQAGLARQLAISPAYLNLLEKGRRKVKLPLLLQALEHLSVDLDSFIASLGKEKPPANVLAHLLDEPLARSLDIGTDAVTHLRAEPETATIIAALFHLYKNTRAQLDAVSAKSTADGTAPILPDPYAPEEEASEFLQAHKSYFPELETRAQDIRDRAGLPLRLHSARLIELLGELFSVEVELAEPRSDSSLIRVFTPEQRTLWLSSHLAEQQRKLQLATVIGLLILDETRFHERLLATARLRHEETPRLVKIQLAGYVARALLLPYAEFFDAVQHTRYDADRLARTFDCSYETVAHRMCSLADPRRPGVPLHLVRADLAGNVSARYSASGLRIAPGHGSCPKWAVHTAFLSPANLATQLSMMPDGAMYFCFARVVSQPIAGSPALGTTYSIGLGASADHAHHFAYADGLPAAHRERTAVPVGSACRLCPRPNCNQRAAPSYRFPWSGDEYREKLNTLNPLVGADTQSGKKTKR